MTIENDAWNQKFTLTYQCQMNRLYHQKRERFFTLLDQFSKAISLLAGTAVFSSLLTTSEAKSWAGLVVALVTLPSLVFTWSEKARLHAELGSSYTLIEAEIVAKGELDWKMLDQISAQIIALSAKEPASLSALVRICQNELAYALGQPDKISKLSWREKHLAHFFDMPTA